MNGELFSKYPAVNWQLSKESLADAKVRALQQQKGVVLNFYRAMHFSAKRGLAISRRLSACLSLTLVDCDHIGWNSSEIISLLVSLGCSVSTDPNVWGLFQGEHSEIWAQRDPPPCWFERRRHSIANCGRMVIDSAIPTGNHHRSFEWCHCWPPYHLPCPQNGGSICPQDTRMAISPQRLIWYIARIASRGHLCDSTAFLLFTRTLFPLSNYRPISILSLISRIIERVVKS